MKKLPDYVLNPADSIPEREGRRMDAQKTYFIKLENNDGRLITDNEYGRWLTVERGYSNRFYGPTATVLFKGDLGGGWGKLEPTMIADDGTVNVIDPTTGEIYKREVK